MTHDHDTEHLNAEPKPSPKKHAPRSRRWMVVVLVLAVLGVAGQQVWTLQLWEGLNREASAVVSVESRIAALESALADQEQVRQEIASLRQSLQQERQLLQLDRLEERLDAGWQLWLATGDSKTLVNALKAGQLALSNAPTATAQALRLAMGRDLVEINAQHLTDLRETVEQLDGIIASVDKLPLVQDRRLQPPETEVPAAPVVPPAETLMDKARLLLSGLADELWQSIRGMVRVQRLDRAETALIAPEQRVFLQQGLRLLLLDARHALIQRNTATYQQTLSQARAWIEKYCDTSNALVNTDLTALQRLSGLNIDPSVVSLDATRQALIAARAALMGEEPVAVTASTPSSETELKPVDTAKTKGAAE